MQMEPEVNIPWRHSPALSPLLHLSSMSPLALDAGGQQFNDSNASAPRISIGHHARHPLRRVTVCWWSSFWLLLSVLLRFGSRITNTQLLLASRASTRTHCSAGCALSSVLNLTTTRRPTLCCQQPTPPSQSVSQSPTSARVVVQADWG